jgi:hypothetical protein
VNAILLNEFLKVHEVQEQEATITQLKKDFRSNRAAQLTTRLDEQATRADSLR